MTFDEVNAWVRRFDLILNRIKVINQLMGERVCKVSFRHGVYRVTLAGSLLATFGVYDLPSVDQAFIYVDAWSDAAWRASSAGLLTC